MRFPLHFLFGNLTFSPHPLGFLAGVLAQSGHGFFWNFLPPARSLLCGFPPKHMACVPEGDGTACGSGQTWSGQLRPLSQGHKQQTRARRTFSLSNLFYFQIFSRISDCGMEGKGTKHWVEIRPNRSSVLLDTLSFHCESSTGQNFSSGNRYAFRANMRKI